LKVGHHGSRENTDEDVVKSVSPEVAVISVGKNNSYGHPAPEVVQLLEESGAKVYRTDECGAVVVRIGKWRYRVDTFLEAAQ
ncbi:MAG: MBL fold metallo-hydrolase, partial [Eubacteriales bacterium]|nr:MBL fold metallo-hydrolase [Eubacteriales bacterium]